MINKSMASRAITGLAMMLQCSMGSAQTAAPEAADARDDGFEEIIVTATKRPESVRHISGSVSAFDESGLETIGAQAFEDYLPRTPGVVFNASVPGNSSAIVRGVATTTGIAQAQGTTGYFIADVPLTDPFYSTGIPDIDTFDVENATVLRGPQGTLFGSASMGGAVNYQAKTPDLSHFDVHLRGGWVRNADVHGYNGNAMVNLPIVDDVFAVRVVYGNREIPGFVDNIGTERDDSNETRISGGRLLATWKPGETTNLTYLYLDQRTETDDLGSVDVPIGEFEKSTQIAEPFDFDIALHNLRLDQEFDLGTLTATATFHEKTFDTQQDYSGLLPPLAPVAFLEPGSAEGDTYELRLASPGDRRFEYVAGIFLNETDESVLNILEAPAGEPVFGTGTLLHADVDIQGREAALFGEGTWHFSDEWKVTLGGRLFRTELEVTTVQSGPFVGPTTTTSGKSSEDGFSPKVALTWEPASGGLYYLLASRGFRFGGPNFTSDPVFQIPEQFDSDSLWNYEAGMRLGFLDDRLLLDGTVYWIDWEDIQVTQTSPSGFTYTDNAGKARNRGAELVGTYRLFPELTLQVTATYLDGVLQSDFESAGGVVPSGAKLPGASEWQTAESIVYAPDLGSFLPELVLTHRYISSAPSELIPESQEQGGYNVFNLRVGGRFDHWGIYLFANNVGDTRGVTRAVSSIRGPTEFLVPPRTFGITVDYRR